jgi:hypothetical protein
VEVPGFDPQFPVLGEKKRERQKQREKRFIFASHFWNSSSRWGILIALSLWWSLQDDKYREPVAE